MGYKVDFDALDTMYSEISQQVSNWTTELQDVAKSINDLVSSDKLTGKGAENIISYFQTVHVAIMQSMMTLLQSHSAYCLMYKSDYQTNIDSSLHAVIHSKELFRIMTKLRVQHTNTTEVDLHIRRALSNVSHLVNTNLTSSGMMEEMYSTIGRDLVNLDSDIVQLENTHLNNDFEETQELIKSLTDFINEYLSTDKAAKTEYTPSQMASSKKYDRLYKAIGYLTKKNQMSAITLGLQQACDHEEERRSLLEDEAAKKREEEGILNAVLAVGTIVIGAVAIVATWGAATPLVVTACVAGGSAMAYGASNLVEAGQDIYYGSIGDPYTVAFNPIRDTVFCGNQEVYDLWGGVATDVAGMLIPIGIASKAAKAAEIGSKAAKSASLASKLTKPNVVQHVASGVHGAVSAGTGSVKQQFYEKGSLEAIDWGEVTGKSAVGGIIGTGTSYGGAKLSQGTTYLLSKNATVSSLLYSESAATRAASNFVVSGTAEVVSGGITRFAGGVLTTGGNVKEAWAQAINPQSIIFDAALGGTMGGFKGIKKPQQNSAVINSDGTASGVQEIKKPQQAHSKLNSINQVEGLFDSDSTSLDTNYKKLKSVYLEQRDLSDRPNPYDGVKQASEYLKSQGVPRAYRKQIIESFDIETIKLQIADESTYGLRFYGGNANAEGRYLFETFTPLTNRENLALPYEWNAMTGIQQFKVKDGVTMITGNAAAQNAFGSQYTGGAHQWYINNLEGLIKCQ